VKFWRVYSGFVHIQDCLTRKKAETVAVGREDVRFERLDIEGNYPHFDDEDLKLINESDLLKELLADVLPFLTIGKASTEEESQ